MDELCNGFMERIGGILAIRERRSFGLHNPKKRAFLDADIRPVLQNAKII